MQLGSVLQLLPFHPISPRTRHSQLPHRLAWVHTAQPGPSHVTKVKCNPTATVDSLGSFSCIHREALDPLQALLQPFRYTAVRLKHNIQAHLLCRNALPGSCWGPTGLPSFPTKTELGIGCAVQLLGSQAQLAAWRS